MICIKILLSLYIIFMMAIYGWVTGGPEYDEDKSVLIVFKIALAALLLSIAELLSLFTL